MNYLKKKLIENNIHCYDWRELFENVHDSEHIALLPSLSKKIPAFDFALIFAEGVDTVQMRGEDVHKSMRDNVLFELGLCVMALGTDRVILFAEDSIHIPDDLIGVGKLGVKHISYVSSDFDLSVDQLSCLLTKLNNNKIQKHINNRANTNEKISAKECNLKWLRAATRA